MDQALIMQQLVQTAEYIVSGERHIALQREILAELRAAGSPTDHAQQLLDQFEDLQSRRISFQHWLVTKLTKMTGPEANG